MAAVATMTACKKDTPANEDNNNSNYTLKRIKINDDGRLYQTDFIYENEKLVKEVYSYPQTSTMQYKDTILYTYEGANTILSYRFLSSNKSVITKESEYANDRLKRYTQNSYLNLTDYNNNRIDEYFIREITYNGNQIDRIRSGYDGIAQYTYTVQYSGSKISNLKLRSSYVNYEYNINYDQKNRVSAIEVTQGSNLYTSYFKYNPQTLLLDSIINIRAKDTILVQKNTYTNNLLTNITTVNQYGRKYSEDREYTPGKSNVDFLRLNEFQKELGIEYKFAEY